MCVYVTTTTTTTITTTTTTRRRRKATKNKARKHLIVHTQQWYLNLHCYVYCIVSKEANNNNKRMIKR